MTHYDGVFRLEKPLKAIKMREFSKSSKFKRLYIAYAVRAISNLYYNDEVSSIV